MRPDFFDFLDFFDLRDLRPDFFDFLDLRDLRDLRPDFLLFRDLRGADRLDFLLFLGDLDFLERLRLGAGADDSVDEAADLAFLDLRLG